MTADRILQEIEARSDALLRADETVGALEADLKAYEAVAVLAHRDSGKSMAESQERVRADDTWSDLFTNLQTARAKAAHAKRHHQSAIIAQDLWRTERATMRAAG